MPAIPTSVDPDPSTSMSAMLVREAPAPGMPLRAATASCSANCGGTASSSRALGVPVAGSTSRPNRTTHPVCNRREIPWCRDTSRPNIWCVSSHAIKPQEPSLLNVLMTPTCVLSPARRATLIATALIMLCQAVTRPLLSLGTPLTSTRTSRAWGLPSLLSSIVNDTVAPAVAPEDSASFRWRKTSRWKSCSVSEQAMKPKPVDEL
mmetsp:Transcript_49998/g.159923  ORF Transcript_49998/g.159923 Transcript_49998/m.159923 type:complete len:206 (-) Transcript_49998:198-815(-)